MTRFALRWLALVALWMAMAATWTTTEIAFASGAGLAVAGFATYVATLRSPRASVRARWVLGIAKLPSQVARDLVILARHLARPGDNGVFRAVPFDVRGDDPYDVGRRALLTAGASLGPNTFLIDWDQEREVVMVHQLERSPRVLPAKGGTVA